MTDLKTMTPEGTYTALLADLNAIEERETARIEAMCSLRFAQYLGATTTANRQALDSALEAVRLWNKERVNRHPKVIARLLTSPL